MANAITRLFARKPQNPRKVTTGTSYTARGLQTIPPPVVDNELGSAAPVILPETVPALVSPFQRLQVYGQMTHDAAVDASMRVAKTPILGADFFMEPFSDDPLDLEISEFIWANLAEGMSSPLLNSLTDILRMYEDGFSILEKVYERREWAPRRTKSQANTKQFVMLKKLGVRPASSVNQFIYDDNGGPNSVTHNAIQGDGKVKEVELKIAKLLIFTFGRVGGDLSGKSLLRTAYPHWYYKNHFYKIDAIQKERHGIGVPRGKLLPGFTTDDKVALRTLLRNLRTNEEAFIIQVPNVEVDFVELTGNPVNVLESAVHHNGMIMLNVLAQFLTLGTTTGGNAGGGRATAGTGSDLFMKSLKYIAQLICDEINMYLIPELVVWNYKSVNFPRLAVRNIGETRDLQMLASAIANLFAQGSVTPTEETEQWTRKLFDMPGFIGTWINPKLQTSNSAPTDQSTSPQQNGSNGSASTNGRGAVGGKGDVRPGQGDAGFIGKPTNAPQ